jgi:hypothetical protein
MKFQNLAIGFVTALFKSCHGVYLRHIRGAALAWLPVPHPLPPVMMNARGNSTQRLQLQRLMLDTTATCAAAAV